MPVQGRRNPISEEIATKKYVEALGLIALFPPGSDDHDAGLQEAQKLLGAHPVLAKRYGTPAAAQSGDQRWRDAWEEAGHSVDALDELESEAAAAARSRTRGADAAKPVDPPAPRPRAPKPPSKAPKASRRPTLTEELAGAEPRVAPPRVVEPEVDAAPVFVPAPPPPPAAPPTGALADLWARLSGRKPVDIFSSAPSPEPRQEPIGSVRLPPPTERKPTQRGVTSGKLTPTYPTPDRGEGRPASRRVFGQLPPAAVRGSGVSTMSTPRPTRSKFAWPPESIVQSMTNNVLIWSQNGASAWGVYVKGCLRGVRDTQEGALELAREWRAQKKSQRDRIAVFVGVGNASPTLLATLGNL